MLAGDPVVPGLKSETGPIQGGKGERKGRSRLLWTARSCDGSKTAVHSTASGCSPEGQGKKPSSSGRNQGDQLNTWKPEGAAGDAQ